MKIAGVLMVLTVVGLGLQGCATTGGTAAATDNSGWHATGPNSAVQTRDAPNQPVVKADTKDDFEAVAAAIHKQMEPGGRWQFVSARERSTIDGNFADMQKFYDQYGSVDKMNASAKMQLAMDQSSINAILTRKDGNKLICQDVIPVGSHLPVRTCKTYAQLEEEQRNTQNQLMQKTQQGNWQQRSGH